MLTFHSYSQIVIEPITAAHPHIFMTGADVDLMRSRVASQQQPWYQSWQIIDAKAQEDKLMQAAPYTGDDANQFYTDCRADSEKALNLAIAYQIDPDPQYADSALKALYQWASQTSSSVPGIYTYDDTNGYNVSTSMLIARSSIQFVFVYDLLYNYFVQNIADEKNLQTVETWFSILAARVEEGIWIWDSNDYFNKQDYQNHLVAHKMGLIAFGYALRDQNMVQFAVDSQDNPRDLVELIAGSIFMEGDIPCSREFSYSPPPTQTGEIYDRYRHYTAPDKGLQYGHLTLTLLSVCAQMTTNNGLDFFQYTAPTGENLELAFDFYSSFYWLKDARVRGGMYSSENDRIALAGDTRAIFELGHHHYPNNRNINRVLEASNRTDITDSKSDGSIWLMGSPVLTHGETLLEEPSVLTLGDWDMSHTVMTTVDGMQKLSIADTGSLSNFMVLGRPEQFGGDDPLYLPTLDNTTGSSVLYFDGNDSAYCPDFRSNYGDFFINFKITVDDVTSKQTVIHVKNLYEIRVVPNTEKTAARLEFLIYGPGDSIETAKSLYTIVPGTTYQVAAWRESYISAVYVDGVTKAFGYIPFRMSAENSNLYLGTTNEFDSRFLRGSISDLEIYTKMYDEFCGDWGYVEADVNKDCFVDLSDFAQIVSNWLD